MIALKLITPSYVIPGDHGEGRGRPGIQAGKGLDSRLRGNDDCVLSEHPIHGVI